MKKLIKSKKNPLLVLMVIVVLSIAEELVIGEGGYGVYLLSPQHRILRFIIRGIYAIILFGLGYTGLYQTGVRWITRIWFLWYGIALIMISLRILLILKFPIFYNNNLYIFFISFYSLLLTPFPYLFLWMLSELFKHTVRNSKT